LGSIIFPAKLLSPAIQALQRIFQDPCSPWGRFARRKQSGLFVKVAGLSWLFQKAKYQAQAEKDYGKSNNVKAEIHALKAPAA